MCASTLVYARTIMIKSVKNTIKNASNNKSFNNNNHNKKKRH